MPSGHVNMNVLKPLSATAWATLAELQVGPIPAYQINPGIRDRFCREGLVIITTGTGANVGKRFVAITAAGREKLKERP